MKTKISLSIDEETLKKIDEMLKNTMFRNKSHVVEYCVTKMLKEIENAN